MPKSPPTESPPTEVHKLSHEGRGIANIDGKTTFIHGALAQETVQFTYTRRRGRFDEGQVSRIIKPAMQRTTPRCPHHGICGGCSLQHMTPEAALAHKTEVLLEQLQQFGKLAPQRLLPPITGPHWGYRRKARLGAKYVEKKQAMLVGFREKNGRYIAQISQCHTLHPRPAQLIVPLQELLTDLEARQYIPQIEVAMGDDELALIFRHLNPLSEPDTQALISFAKQHALRLYLQPGGLNSIHCAWPQGPMAPLHYTLPQHQITIQFEPTDFIQVNAEVNQQLVQRAIELLTLEPTDNVLDLFCGIGNFSLPLARYAKQVTGVEGNNIMTQRAEANAQHNDIHNAHFTCMDLQQTIDRPQWLYMDKVLLDPPRTGAAELMQLPWQAKRMVYISCNPATLARDAGLLVTQGYTLEAVGAVDMFPHTQHTEAMALFTRE